MSETKAYTPTAYDRCVVACLVHATLCTGIAMIAVLPNTFHADASSREAFSAWLIFTYAWLAWPFVLPRVPHEKTCRPLKPLLWGFIIWLPSGGLPLFLLLALMSGLPVNC